VVELPDFEILKRQPKVPHVARAVARRVVPNEHGAQIEYTVHQNRNGRKWWISASLEGMRMSNTLHTTTASKAAEWIRAVQTGHVRVHHEQKSAAQLEREIQEALAKLDEKRRRSP
jgi:hypothetical protein